MNHEALIRMILAVVVFVTLASSSLLQRTWAQQLAAPGPATASIDRAELHQALLDLSSPWTVMCIAAHPDDEDGTTLTILRRKHGINTVTLFSTYGEGGQNAVGPELYRELGVIRARETLAASAIQGSEPHFLDLVDFGYSKSATETFRIWGEREALRRMVLKIRQLRPDVIITNHNTTSGHGHHQATGRLALQAFDAAADRTLFPEQLKRFEPWQAKRLFVRFGFGGSENNAPDKGERVISVDPNEYDPVRKKTFAEQALAALQEHSSQGPWPKTVADRLKALKRTSLPLIRYRLVREAQTTPSLPSEARIFVDGLILPLSVGSKLAPLAVNHQSLTEFADKRDEALVVLLNARKAGAFTAPAEVHALDAPRFRLMSNRLDRALAVASGVSLDLRPGGPLVPGGKSRLTAAITNAGDAEVLIRKLSLQAWGTNSAVGIAGKLPPGTDTSEIITANPPKRLPLTVPAADHLYDGRFLGEPLVLKGELATDGVAFDLATGLRVPVVPQVEIQRITPALHVITEATADPAVFKISLKNHSPTTFQGQLRLSFSNQSAKAIPKVLSLDPGENCEVTMEVDNMKLVSRRGGGWRQGGTIALSVNTNDLQSIAQREIRWAYSDAQVTAGLKVGYLPSFDQTLQESLAALGVEATELSVNEIRKGALARFQTIIIDNRGYQAHTGLIEANPKLLEYVKNGGNLIVFYHRTNEWNPSEQENRPQLAPYPILLGSERITQEDAPVTLINPEHRLLREPNRITQLDFRGWIQERGLYYPREWARQYEVLVTSNDTGEKPLSGGLLVAKYGSGTYIYTSMVWYRQLQAGVPGGYRVFANMISYRD